MISPLTKEEYNQIRSLLIDVCGISLKNDQEYLVETRLADFANELGVNSFGQLYQKVTKNQTTYFPKIVDLMTTNETFWFRDTSFWSCLKNRVLPDLINKIDSGYSQVKIWSAGCSTGQEPYSLLMLLNEILIAERKEEYLDRFYILGTDISGNVLSVARNGVYDSFSIQRGLERDKLDLYFRQSGSHWEIVDKIKKRVSFREVNLMNSFSFLGEFDIIFCRNVAIYFSDIVKKDLFKRFAASLRKDGVLFIGATESLIGVSDELKQVSSGSGVYYTL